ncbi:MAG: adenylate/guanylate cyclase domain-containing protein [Leptospiraceae bacterium]|nr:adenylate/guanylate cyclase domain-containing protein [Leptospiraceae bacterium]
MSAQTREIETALQTNEIRAEHQINVFRAVLFIGSFCMDIGNAWLREVLSTQYLTISAITLPVVIIYLVLIHQFTKGSRYHAWIKYLTISCDYLMLAAIYTEMQQSPFDQIFPVIIMIPLLTTFAILLNTLNAFRHSTPALVYSTTLGGSLIALSGLDSAVPFEAVLWSLPSFLASAWLIHWISSNLKAAFLKIRRRETLTRFLPRDLVDMIDAGTLQIEGGGTELKATILFADIRNFTSLSARHTPTEILTVLNEYFTAMAAIIFECGGMIDKYIGDAIMAVFGIPESRADDSRRAIEAARKMQSALADLNTRWQAVGKETLQMGIALHTGIVVAGNIGSPQRMDYTVIGDTVNVTARLEGLNKLYQTDILFSENTMAEISPDFACRLVAKAEIRGKTEAVRVYTLV